MARRLGCTLWIGKRNGKHECILRVSLQLVCVRAAYDAELSRVETSRQILPWSRSYLHQESQHNFTHNTNHDLTEAGRRKDGKQAEDIFQIKRCPISNRLPRRQTITPIIIGRRPPTIRRHPILLYQPRTPHCLMEASRECIPERAIPISNRLRQSVTATITSVDRPQFASPSPPTHAPDLPLP